MRRRRLRLILPFAVVLALVTITVTAHVAVQPDPGEASFLSPASDAGDGAKRLADGLTRLGVRVDVHSSSATALKAVSLDGSTVFVTAPAMLPPETLDEFLSLPSQSRVVLVAPTAAELDGAGLDVTVDGPRWAAAAPEPGCFEKFAQAGPAAAERLRYDATPYGPVHCYDGGVVEFRAEGAELTLVGAADPFRNDRAGEHGNHELALALLSRLPRVVWLDLHRRESPPTPSPEPTYDEGEDPYAPEPPAEPADPERADPPPAPGAPFPAGEGDQSAPQAEDPNPLLAAFPPALWATLVLLAFAAVALAAASARRLGAPVAEPLPARVRTAETVRGLGGLYRRARARSTSLATVQAAARRRLAGHLGLPPEVPVDVLAGHVSAASGRHEDEVRQLLGGGHQDSDEELTRAATEVQRLVRAVTGAQPAPQRALDEGNVT